MLIFSNGALISLTIVLCSNLVDKKWETRGVLRKNKSIRGSFKQTKTLGRCSFQPWEARSVGVLLILSNDGLILLQLKLFSNPFVEQHIIGNASECCNNKSIWGVELATKTRWSVAHFKRQVLFYFSEALLFPTFPDPADPAHPADPADLGNMVLEPALRPSLRHAPGVRMTVVQNKLPQTSQLNSKDRFT